jgi:hypothetical protein
MSVIKIRLNKILFFLSLRFNLFFIILSFLTFLSVFLQINGILGGLFNGLNLISVIFILLILPSFPIYFFIFKFENLKLIERLCLTIVTNLSIYILEGFIGNSLKIPLTPLFFFSLTFYLFIILIGSTIIIQIKKNTILSFIKSKTEIDKERFYTDFSILNFIKDILSINGIILIIFIFMFISSDFLRSGYFVGIDPWLHISIIRSITETYQLPAVEYFGAMGLHIFSVVFHYFSGISAINIPRVSLFYTFPVSSLIAYCLLKRVFKYKNFAIFGVYLLTFTSLGFSQLMHQYWPSGLTYIQGLMIFLLLFIRLQAFIKERPPNREDIFVDILKTYIPVILIFISALITHSLITIIIIISFVWVYLIYFCINVRRGFDFFLLLGLMCIFFLFYSLNISTGHFRVFSRLSSFPIQYIVLGLIAGASAIVLYILYTRKGIKFTSGRYNLIIFGKRKRLYKVIEDRFLIPILITLVILTTIIFFITNSIWLNLNLLLIFAGIELALYIVMALWGFEAFRYKPRGRALKFWAMALFYLIFAGIIFDVFTDTLHFYSRIFYITSVVIVIGFISYFQKLMKLGGRNETKSIVLLILIVPFSLFASFTNINVSMEIYTLKKREVSAIQWYSHYTTGINTIIGENGWDHVFVYYNYPFGNQSYDLSFKEIHNFISANDDLMHPTNHILSNGTNILTEMKKDTEMDVYLFLSDYYVISSGSSLYGELIPEEIEQYYNLNYLNRIFSAKSENGESMPIYWVI